MTSYARFSTGHYVPERATLSTFHHLQNIYRSSDPTHRRVYSEEDYRDFLAVQRRRVQSNRTITEAERASILARMDRADAQPTPNQATIHALMNVTLHVRGRRDAMQNFISNIAETSGLTNEEVTQDFNRIAAAVPGRTAVSAQDATLAAQYGLARDAGTVAAMNHLLSTARDYQAALARVAPQRITSMIPVEHVAARVTQVDGLQVDRWGYDPRNGRLEVTLQHPDGELTSHAYHNVTPTVYAAMQDDAGYAWAEYVRGNPNFQYASEQEAAIDGAAPRCRDCGQFADDQHVCPTQAGSSSGYSESASRSAERDLLGSSPIPAMETPPVPAVTHGRRLITDSTALLEEGYDPETGRLELVMRSNPSHVYAYTLPPHVYDAFINSPSMGSYYARQIRNNPQYRASNILHPVTPDVPVAETVEPLADWERELLGHLDAEQGAAEPLATVPVREVFRRGTRGMRWTQQTTSTGTVLLPSLGHLQEPARSRTGVEIEFAQQRVEVSGHPGRISGNVIASQSPVGRVSVASQELRCDCPEWRRNSNCIHVNLVTQAVSDRLAGTRPVPAAAAAAEPVIVPEPTPEPVVAPIAVATDPMNFQRWGGYRWTVQGIEQDGRSHDIELPAVRVLRDAARSRGAMIDIRSQRVRTEDASGNLQIGIVRGDVLATQDGNTAPVLLDTRQLRCSCQAWQDNRHCIHIDLIGRAIQQRVSGTRPARDPNAPAELTTFGRNSRAVRWTQQVVTQYVAESPTSARAREIRIGLPGIRALSDAARNGGARIEFNTYVNAAAETNPGVHGPARGNQGNVSGYLNVTQAGPRAEAVVDYAELRCNCPEWRNSGHCVHVDLVGQSARDRLERADRLDDNARAERDRLGREAAITYAATRMQREADAALATDWMRNDATAAEARRTWREATDVLYSEDRSAFIEDIRAAQEATAAKGSPAIPYMTENALDGLCRRGSGKAFGVEIEYQFAESMSYREREDAQRRIGQQLYDAGLTYSPDQQNYRASQRRGFRDVHNQPNGEGNWSWEHDGSVDGELVTPGMYDEPETWTKLETAIRILRDNGAVAGTKAGAHVHVGTADYQGSPAAYTELARMVTQHEDAIARLASDPDRGEHRNNGYSQPLPPVPPTGFANVTAARQWQTNSAGRYAVMNLANVSGGDGDHPEFRIFDSTLDPGAMQAQIKLAVAMTDAARRNAEAGGTSRGKEPWGAHVRRGTTTTGLQSPEDIAAEGSTICSLLDTLYRRREDKAQAAAVIANTRWTLPSAGH